jgi:o-succinylbenzoate synthase
LESLAACLEIWTSPYELVAKADGRRRSGALLRVDFGDGVGYADLHPWPELGDLALEEQLGLLTNGLASNLTRQSLRFAQIDAEYRTLGKSCFDGLTIPASHVSLPFGFTTQDIRACAGSVVKLKDGNLSQDLLAAFREFGVRVRLDFNLRESYDSLAVKLGAWGELSWIDWIEDPFPADKLTWNRLRQEFGVRLALDFADPTDFDAYDVRVIKPARDETPRGLDAGKTPCFTSYLDHPLGQLTAAWQAAVAVRDGLPVEVCGLNTHTVYEPNQFSTQLSVDSGRLVPPEGPGFGFQQELDEAKWERIR